jgi:hypothetical protein
LQPSSYISLPGRARYSILPGGELRNEIGPTGAHAVRAKVYYAESWFDQKQAIILDYSKSSLLAHWIRDEIRLVVPGLYLGIVYWDGHKILNFALHFGV